MPPTFAPPPPPANYVTYDEDGNPAGSQTWNTATNTYEYRPAPLTDEQKQQKAQRESLQTQMLGNLGQTPADRVQAYTDYANTISKNLHQDADYQFGNMTTAQNEGYAARGLMGSRAYVDAQAALDRNKTLSDTSIANQAELGKENLANQDRSFWVNTLGELDNNQNAQASIAQNNARNIMTGGQMANQDLLSGYNSYNGANLQNYAMNVAQNNFNTKQYMDTASGLAFLYGYNTPGRRPDAQRFGVKQRDQQRGQWRLSGGIVNHDLARKSQGSAPDNRPR